MLRTRIAASGNPHHRFCQGRQIVTHDRSRLCLSSLNHRRRQGVFYDVEKFESGAPTQTVDR